MELQSLTFCFVYNVYSVCRMCMSLPVTNVTSMHRDIPFFYVDLLVMLHCMFVGITPCAAESFSRPLVIHFCTAANRLVFIVPRPVFKNILALIRCCMLRLIWKFVFDVSYYSLIQCIDK